MRHETRTWTIRSEVPGRLRLYHPLVGRSSELVQDVEIAARRLDRRLEFSSSPFTSTILLRFDPAAVSRDGLLSVLSDALTEGSRQLRAGEMAEDLASLITPAPAQLTASTASMVLAAAAIPFPVLRLPALLLTLASAAHIAGRAAKALVVERKVKVDLLDATVILSAVYFRQVPAAAFMVWVVDLSDLLLQSSADDTRRRLREIFGYQVRKAWRLVGESEVECDVVDLAPGDVVVVRSGDQVPVDGVVIEGAALVDQAPLTGESVPAEKTAGDRVFAMTLLIAGSARVRVTQTGEATNAARMVQIIEHSLQHRVALQTTSERFANGVVVPTLALGLLAKQLRGDSAMLAVINADYDTGIRFAGPIAMLSSLSTAARHGILVKNGRALEALHKLDAIIFDKTGTLTVEVPQVERVVSYDPELDGTRILRLAAIAERRFSHPIARAILNRAEEMGLELPWIADSDYEIGFGVRVQVEGETVHVGSQRYLERQGIALPPEIVDPPAGADHGSSVVLVAAGGRLAGSIELRANPRPEARALIESIRRRGIREIYLLSGDAEPATRTLAAQLGIERYASRVQPHEKAEHVRRLQARGLKVGMVGDGINDSAALSRADCSISLMGAADVARDVADVVFLDGDLAKFETLFAISDNLLGNVRTGLLLVAIPNTILIAGALVGFFGLPASLVLNNVFNLVCVANGWRAQSNLKPWVHLPESLPLPATEPAPQG